MAERRKALEAVRRRIEQACHRSDRDPGAVALIAVSKTFSAERVLELRQQGQHLFGENRVQEALSKIPRVGSGATWHLIGPLQRNKARHAVGVFELIHSVDSAKLATELDRRAAAAGLRQAILVQLNLAKENTKSGVGETELWPLLDAIADRPHLDLQGLMTIPPRGGCAEESRPWFAALRDLRDRATARLGRPLPHLSMGMTADFEVAIEEGATLIRVGRAIFGPRT